ncbi:MAG: isoprenylcysteine carboxylmethyltransferase family protein [Thermoguttaceae bacterium]|nr:isoprenylcysteine carboxylmethyltransferase family protein [Thermoguttaceae bacterium]
MQKEAHEKLRMTLTWFFVLGLAALVFVSASAWEYQPIVEEMIFFGSCFLVGVGVIGRAWCAVYISGRKDGMLVQSGPYAMCRHPLYFFSFLAAIGVGFGTETLTIPAIVVIASAIYYPIVIASEERRLEALFGDEFRIYAKRVPSFFPRWSLLKGNEPDAWPVCTVAVRRTLFDLLWFFWIVGLLELIEAFHETNVVPVMILLY